MKKTLLIEPHYLPCIEYFSLLKRYKNVVFDVNDLYVKQTYRNRGDILGNNKVIPLSVPVHHTKPTKSLKEIEINYDQDWRKQHWRSIQSSYGKSPFFEYYVEYFSSIYEQKFKFLVDINMELLSVCLKILQIDIEMTLSESLIQEEANFDMLKSYIKPAISYKDRCILKKLTYTQVFGSEFVNNLSIIDLIFCKGPESNSYLDEVFAGDDDYNI